MLLDSLSRCEPFRNTKNRVATCVPLGSTAELKDEDFDEEDRQARRREAYLPC